MGLRECYEEIGADYESVLGRLGSDALICTFLKKYFAKNEYEALENAVKEEKWEEAFICAHNMKGIGLNLSLTELAEAGSVLCEALRGGSPEGDVNAMLLHVKSVYTKAENAVSTLEVE